MRANLARQDLGVMEGNMEDLQEGLVKARLAMDAAATERQVAFPPGGNSEAQRRQLEVSRPPLASSSPPLTAKCSPLTMN